MCERKVKFYIYDNGKKKKKKKRRWAMMIIWMMGVLLQLHLSIVGMKFFLVKMGYYNVLKIFKEKKRKQCIEILHKNTRNQKSIHRSYYGIDSFFVFIRALDLTEIFFHTNSFYHKLEINKIIISIIRNEKENKTSAFY